MMPTKKDIRGHGDRPEVQMGTLWVTASWIGAVLSLRMGFMVYEALHGSSNLSVRSPRPRCRNRISTLVETLLA